MRPHETLTHGNLTATLKKNMDNWKMSDKIKCILQFISECTSPGFKQLNNQVLIEVSRNRNISTSTREDVLKRFVSEVSLSFLDFHVNCSTF